MQLIPFDNRDGLIWMNGNFINWNDAKVHVLNHGLHYGSCVLCHLPNHSPQPESLVRFEPMLLTKRNADLPLFQVPKTHEPLPKLFEQVHDKLEPHHQFSIFL